MLDACDTLEEVERRALESLRPPPRLTLSDWVEHNIYLPHGVSSLPGLVQLWPFQREIADAIGDPAIERVTLVKPVRVGFTTLLTGALGAFVANDPAPILALLPTEADCRDYMVSEIEPIFSASPVLADALGEAKDESGRNTILSRRFPGGSLKIVAAKAPRNLRRHTARVLLVDEADGMEVTAEGPPIALAEKRTLSFADRKIVIGSTPTFEGTSYILRSYSLSDRRIFETPCFDCRAPHEIVWSDIQWPEGRPAEAYYVCPSCGCVVSERHKLEMVNGGAWRATAPEVIGHAGFRLNALVSLLPNASWGKLATEFVAAKSDRTTLQVFVNTILAEGFRVDGGEEIDDEALAKRAEPFGCEAMPEEVLAITAGVDVQRDRLEVTLLGWTEAGPMLALGAFVIWGRPEDDSTWAELDDLLKRRFPHPLGGTIGIDATAIDSGDGETMEQVYKFCFPRAARKIFAIKGDGGFRRPFIERSSSSKARGGMLFIVGVDPIKDHITAKLTGGNGAIRFSDTLPASWYEQLCSERAIIRYSRGQPTRRFERIPGRRAEALDCVVYGVAARYLLNINWAARAEALRSPELALAPAMRPRVIRSSWIDG
ncbi:phage terminase large subunit family protein [Rhodopseudomonas sp. G2_2311]|uniref:phage terminase large subunit family protein n=1 Tax=Rhodopseudomonas sp. G2_2311 TaxID=3114287 RepID=UPI0039C66584